MNPAQLLRAALATTLITLLTSASSSLAACDALVSAGTLHALAVRPDDTTWAWGDNINGQLGVVLPPGQLESNIPVEIVALRGRGVVAVAAGRTHSLALLADGTIWAWGDNRQGQLGIGNLLSQPVPVPVTTLTDVIAISAGGSHSLALTRDGGTWAWGDNSWGQLGDGNLGLDASMPLLVDSLPAANAIAAGRLFSMVLLPDGSIRAWGSNYYGELANSATLYYSDVPVVSPITGVTAIAAGSAHALAVTADGRAWAWGDGSFGKLGNGDLTMQDRPVAVSGLAGVRSVDGGVTGSLALLDDGSLHAWGRGAQGARGDGIIVDALVPVPVSGLAGVSTYSIGGFALAGLDDGSIHAWGGGLLGMLGDGREGYVATPARVPGGLVAADLIGTEDGFMAILADTSLVAWGSNQRGQLGNGSTTHASAPVPVGVPGLVGVTQAAGATTGFALLADRSLWSWGYNAYGQEGTGTRVESHVPVRVVSTSDPSGYLTDVVAVSANSLHALAVRGDGSCWAWGSDLFGACGTPWMADLLEPERVALRTGPPDWLANVTGVAAGYAHSLALHANGTVSAWGDNSEGQLGDGGVATSRYSPETIVGLGGVTQVAAGAMHSLALLSDGSILAWGGNGWGEIGDGTLADRSSPVPVATAERCVAIAAGSSYSLALTESGTVLAWGFGNYGATGLGERRSSLVPVAVIDPSDASGLLQGVVRIAAGYAAGGALKSDGSVWTWGDNSLGQLGNGVFGHAALPVVPDNLTLPDTDGDGVLDACDACPGVVNPGQADADGDGQGDECDACTDTDGDGAGDPGFPASTCATDNCPGLANDQANADGDAAGDACDPCPLDPADGCGSSDLLRHGALPSRSFASHASIFTTPGGDPALDAVRDLQQAGVAGLAPITLPGDAAFVGDGSAGVVVFYEISQTAGPLMVQKAGDAIVLSGW